MFGDLSPRIPNLLVKANTWTKTNTWALPALGATTVSAAVYSNSTPATSGNQQASPSVEWQGNGFRTSGSLSQSVNFRSYVIGVQGSGNPAGSWKLESSVAGAAYTAALEFLTTALDGITYPRLNVTGAIRSSVSNSSTIDTLQNFDLVNPSGTRVNITATFGATIRWGIQATDQGAAIYKAAGSSATHYFQVGSNIGSNNDILQISSVGLYNYGGSFNSGRVTAGTASTTSPAFLNSYGSLAVRGTYKTENATLSENETMVYVDASSNAICAGTPSVTNCATYGNEVACVAHVGCTWNPATTEPCSGYGGVDLTTCVSQSGCTFDQVSCAGPSDESSCIAQDDTYGGSCAWNLCSGFTDTASCNAQSGCSASVTSDCSVFSDGGGDGSACATQSECSYESGTGVCSGTYFTSCDGGYCTGDYYPGSCSGTHTVTPANCSGTVTCAGYTSSGPCAAETGCSWTTGVEITLPSSSLANAGNTSRLYSIVNIGSSGTITVLPTSPDTILGYGSGVILNATNERVMLHHHNVQSNCSVYNSNQASCESTTGCSWSAAVVCADLLDESACNTQSSVCSWNGSSCTGAGAASSCGGTFTASKPWIIHQLSN